LNQAQALVGTTTNVLAVATTAHTRVIENAVSEAARLGETDLIAGTTELAQAQNALEAVLAASAKSFKLSLLDRL
jgi:flagellin-like hook-associated protein FlgL